MEACDTQRYPRVEVLHRAAVEAERLGNGSDVDDRVMFTSTGGLRDHAYNAGVSIDVALAYGLTSQLVSYFFDMEYHKVLRSCPMDFTEDHADIARGLQRGAFCSQCLRHLGTNPSLKRSVLSMLKWGRG